MVIELPDALVKKYQEARMVTRELLITADEIHEQCKQTYVTHEHDRRNKLIMQLHLLHNKKSNAARSALDAKMEIDALVATLLEPK